MIPKKIHQIWLGPKPIPADFEPWIRSWKEKHPEWSYRLWTSADLPPLVNQVLFDAYEIGAPAPLRYGFQADLLRLEILARHGGVYADVDHECIRPLDDLMVQQTFVVSMEPLFERHIQNDFIAARPNHPLLWEMIRLAPERAARVRTQVTQGGYAEQDVAGPRALFEVVHSGRYHDVTILPFQVIHPYRRMAKDGYGDYDGAAYVRNHFRAHLGMWAQPASDGADRRL